MLSESNDFCKAYFAVMLDVRTCVGKAKVTFGLFGEWFRLTKSQNVLLHFPCDFETSSAQLQVMLDSL